MLCFNHILQPASNHMAAAIWAFFFHRVSMTLVLSKGNGDLQEIRNVSEDIRWHSECASQDLGVEARPCITRTT